MALECACCVCWQRKIPTIFLVIVVFFQSVWSSLRSQWNWIPIWGNASFRDNLVACSSLSTACSVVALYSVWEVWHMRNRLLFNGIKACVDVTVVRISTWISLSTPSHDHDLLPAPPFVAEQHPYPYGFFDGAAKFGDCGAGFVLKLGQDHFIHVILKAGSSSNNRAKLVALWALPWYTAEKDFGLTHIYGDSLCVIEWAKGRADLNILLLKLWLSRVRALINKLPNLSFSHLYRCFNEEEDKLSKTSLGDMDGLFHCKEFVDGTLTGSQVIRYLL